MSTLSTRKKDPEPFGPAAFVHLAMPFWEAVLGSDTPDFVFQPVKVLALGQIQTAALINKRCLACLELPQKLAACRSPKDVMQVNQRFFQSAMRDYSGAVHAMTQAWDKAVAEQADNEAQTRARHDYLPLPKLMSDQDHAAIGQGSEEIEAAPSAPASRKRRSNGAAGGLCP